MHINKFTKGKDGMYKIELDNGAKLVVHEDLILKYNLLLNKEIDSVLEEKILIENNNYLAYNKAIKYISIKMRSCKELKTYLQKLSIDSNIIDSIIQKLVYQGYLNDKSYCIAFVNDKINLSNDGPNKIRSLLLQNEIEESVVNEALQTFDTTIQAEKISKLVTKYSKSNNKGAKLLRQKILMNLINLGYDKNIILDELSKFHFDDTSLYKREYQKLHDKLSKKYSGSELEYRIKQKMYQKGFSNY